MEGGDGVLKGRGGVYQGPSQLCGVGVQGGKGSSQGGLLGGRQGGGHGQEGVGRG